MKHTAKNDIPDTQLHANAGDRPANTLLHNWGKKMAEGNAAVIPVFIGGSWTLQVPRGNKRILRVNVPKKR